MLGFRNKATMYGTMTCILLCVSDNDWKGALLATAWGYGLDRLIDSEWFLRNMRDTVTLFGRFFQRPPVIDPAALAHAAAAAAPAPFAAPTA